MSPTKSKTPTEEQRHFDGYGMRSQAELLAMSPQSLLDIWNKLTGRDTRGRKDRPNLVKRIWALAVPYEPKFRGKGRPSKWPENARIRVLKPNPHAEGSNLHRRFAGFTGAGTIAEAVANGVLLHDIQWYVDRNIIVVGDNLR